MRRRPSSARRRLLFQTVEARELLAADTGLLQPATFAAPAEPAAIIATVASTCPFDSEDVNHDGKVTPLDSLVIINWLARGSQYHSAMDTNLDGAVTPLDALRVINRMMLSQYNDGLSPGPDCPTEIQSIDGTGNHLDDPSLGSAGTQLKRIVETDYADGFNAPSGENRRSAREISNLVSAQDGSILNDRRLSDLIWQFGQFIDHDINLTAGEDPAGERFNIPVPSGDVFFDPLGSGTQEIELTRSTAADGSGGTDSVRQQTNQITAFIDGSMIYGSDNQRAAALRSFQDGRLLTSQGDLLPLNTAGLDNAGGTDDTLFLAGDIRANEQVGLLAMHTLWVREHNRLAGEIAGKNPAMNDEDVFQRARRIVIGQLQVITFQEYLPALLGTETIQPYQGYDAAVNPSISNLFATAGFRYGHSTLSPQILRLDNDGNVIDAGNLALRDAFFHPAAIIDQGIESVLKGLASQQAQEVDTRVVDDLRNFLFGPPGSGGFDLVSLNIQRGRDHGLPDYNRVRQQLGLSPVDSFADITSDTELQAALRQAYGDTSDIDVWVGVLAEDHLPGSSVGETLQTIIAGQFMALRDGDRFWYQNVLTGDTLRQVQSTRLSDVIQRNTGLTTIQSNAFFLPTTDGADR
ncbi:dockerin type I domain-containing protein [Stieleria sp. TO1_6]|uniref:peroxidase family protein n=1 Tax=Stieleria tagensis TaxID=2956795 RepID=UPI00209B7C8F|nr:peroxidase family protein [Stieleria tagensis]MCO8122089.1 dockerin type I domain-containing protein [Stieleria tagensis]